MNALFYTKNSEMKKRIFLLAMFALVGGASFYYAQRQSKQPVSDLVQMNVEALAAGEGGVSAHCIMQGCLDCPYSYEKVKYVFSGYSLE